MNLYELSADLVVLRDLEEVEASEIIAIVQNEIANKGKGIIQVVRSIEADVDAVKK